MRFRLDDIDICSVENVRRRIKGEHKISSRKKKKQMIKDEYLNEKKEMVEKNHSTLSSAYTFRNLHI